jgi:hypothetical protein
LAIAINAARLSLLLLGAVAYLLGQGWLLFKLVSHDNKVSGSLLQLLPLAISFGLLTNLGLILIVQDLSAALIIGCIVSVIGLYFLVRELVVPRTRIEFAFGSPYAWIGAALVWLLFLSPILANPLRDWDARSIWFFHGKMIYAAGSIGQQAGWQDVSVSFSHPDYPKLVPVLAAQLMTLRGYWNEYLPKASLLIILLPAILWLFSFARKPISFAVLLILVPFTFYKLIWNGYMDGYLAFYFSIALLFVGRYTQSAEAVDLLSGLCCLALLLYLKNEGTLAALAGICSILSPFLLKKSASAWYAVKINWRYILASALALLPYLVWFVYKWQWNLSNDLEIGTTQSINRIIERATDGSYQFILQSVFNRAAAGLLLLTLLYFMILWRRLTSWESVPALLAATLYCLGLITIYLLTPYNLEGHVNTSIDRTMLTVNAAVFVGCYFMLNTLESNGATESQIEKSAREPDSL